MHKARCSYGRTSLSFFAQVRLLTIKVSYLIDGSYYPWTYSYSSTPVVLLVCMKSYQRSFLSCCSFRKADAKVDVLQLPTKQKRNFFPEFFVNKYNSLNMTTDNKNKRGAALRLHLFYLRVRIYYSAAGASAAGASSTGASAAGAAFSAAGLRERRVLAAFFTVLAMFSS